MIYSIYNQVPIASAWRPIEDIFFIVLHRLILGPHQVKYHEFQLTKLEIFDLPLEQL